MWYLRKTTTRRFKVSGDKIVKKVSFSSESLLHMFGPLQKHQETFKKTGGSHAAGIFDKQFQLLTIREDIGRHNAVDKCVGNLLQKNSLKNGITPVCDASPFLIGLPTERILPAPIPIPAF